MDEEELKLLLIAFQDCVKQENASPKFLLYRRLHKEEQGYSQLYVAHKLISHPTNDEFLAGLQRNIRRVSSLMNELRATMNPEEKRMCDEIYQRL